MSAKHTFRYKLKFFIWHMRLCFPPEKDFYNRIINDMVLRGKDLRDTPTLMIAICLEKLPIRDTSNETVIIQTIEQATRHIIGMPDGLNIEDTLVYFANHNNWEYQLEFEWFSELVELFLKFTLIYHQKEM